MCLSSEERLISILQDLLYRAVVAAESCINRLLLLRAPLCGSFRSLFELFDDSSPSGVAAGIDLVQTETEIIGTS